MTVIAILQARVTSNRLPNKVMTPILGQPMLMRQIERIQRAKAFDSLVVATSDDISDDVIELLCDAIGIRCFRGDLNDVLTRIYNACLAFGPVKHVVRLTGDCPLIDPTVIDNVILHHLKSGADCTTNAAKPSWPDGLDVEVLNIATLKRAFECALLPSEREHATSYVYKNPELFRIEHIKCYSDLSHLRWTVDEYEDLVFVTNVYTELYQKKPDFVMHDILELLERKPGLVKINNQFLRNEGYTNSIMSDLTSSKLK